jgi:hypothetical protein
MAAPVRFTVLGQVDDPAVYAALAAIQVRKACGVYTVPYWWSFFGAHAESFDLILILALLKQEVKAKDAAVESDEQTFTEVEWEECLRKQQLVRPYTVPRTRLIPLLIHFIVTANYDQNLGGACYGHKTSPLVLKDGAFLGGLKVGVYYPSSLRMYYISL